MCDNLDHEETSIFPSQMQQTFLNEGQNLHWKVVLQKEIIFVMLWWTNALIIWTKWQCILAEHDFDDTTFSMCSKCC
jgi:hypothetical protein